MTNEELIEEVKRYYSDNFEYLSSDQPTLSILTDIARHFYYLGCRRTAEKFDEIEYNRQRTEESVPNDLEQAAGYYAVDNASYWQEDEDKDIYSDADKLKSAFIAGAEWNREQMMKEAIGGNAYPNDGEIWVDLARYGYKFKEGEPCRIIIVKE